MSRISDLIRRHKRDSLSVMSGHSMKEAIHKSTNHKDGRYQNLTVVAPRSQTFKFPEL